MRVQSKLAGLLTVVIVAAILSNANITGMGKQKSYAPGPGERGYNIKLGAVSTLSLAKTIATVNGETKKVTLHGGVSGEDGNGPGIWAWGFTAKAGTTITIQVIREGTIGNGTRNGQIACSVLEDGHERSQQQSGDPFVSIVNCAWVVGAAP